MFRGHKKESSLQEENGKKPFQQCWAAGGKEREGARPEGVV